jgi:hypothetical protein
MISRIVAFQSGFFTQTHVLDIIKNRKEDTLLVLDSCYSGSWVQNAKNQHLEQSKGRIVIQSSSGADEEAYGMAFAPALDYISSLVEDDFKALILDFKSKVTDDGNLFLSCCVQYPMLYDSRPSDTSDVFVEFHGLRLFNSQLFFGFVCSKIEGMRSFTFRGVSDAILDDFCHTGKVVQFKLKTMQTGPFAGSPLAISRAV